jgi:hypothetical protein
MNWDAIGATGEVLGAIAVVVSLVYLAFQIRQNTRQIDENTKAAQAAAFDSSIAHTFKARQAIAENSDVALIYLDGSNDPDSLSEEDRVRYRLIVHNILWSLWNIQSQSQVGGELASETWSAQLAILKRMMSTRGFRWFWGNYSQEFGASFQKIVDDLEGKSR